jgi:hypothetical protein
MRRSTPADTTNAGCDTPCIVRVIHQNTSLVLQKSVAISVRNSEILFDCQTIRLPCTTIYSTRERSWRLLSLHQRAFTLSGSFSGHLTVSV